MNTITGTIHLILPKRQVTEKFAAQELVLHTNDKYPQYIVFQAANDKCKMLDPLLVGQEATITFSVRGREYKKEGQEPRYFNTLEIISIDAQKSEAVSEAPTISEDENNLLPF